MGEIGIVGLGKTRRSPYPVCKNKSMNAKCDVAWTRQFSLILQT